MVITQKITSLAFEIHDGKAFMERGSQVHFNKQCACVCVSVLLAASGLHGFYLFLKI